MVVDGEGGGGGDGVGDAVEVDVKGTAAVEGLVVGFIVEGVADVSSHE